MESARKKCAQLQAENELLKSKPEPKEVGPNFEPQKPIKQSKAVINCLRAGNYEALSQLIDHVSVDTDENWRNFQMKTYLERAKICSDPLIKKSLERQALIEYYGEDWDLAQHYPEEYADEV